MSPLKTIIVQNIPVSIITEKESDFISLTDMAKSKEGDSRSADIIKNWIRARTTLEFLGTWETIYNANFKVVEFDHFKMQAGLPTFALGPGQWVEKTNAVGIYVVPGRYGGTYAHKDIAFEFGSAINPVFKLYLIKEFQRLKEEENSRLKSEWNLQRTLSKINYRIHTDAIKEQLIPATLTREQKNMIYSSEADVLNMALFGQTAAMWRKNKYKGDVAANTSTRSENIRDHATLEQLVVLTNLESLNSVLIRQGLNQADRLQKLNDVAISQMKSLLNNEAIKKLK